MAGRRLERGQQKGKKPGKCEKDVKIEGTNSISPLESTKVSKNKLKTNWFLSAKKAKQTRKRGQKNVFCRAFNPNPSESTDGLAVGASLAFCACAPILIAHTGRRYEKRSMRHPPRGPLSVTGTRHHVRRLPTTDN
jgi:hypothetical protein